MRLECTSLTAHRYSLPSAVGCSVMSVSHSRLGAGCGEDPLDAVIVHRRPGPAVLAAAGLAEAQTTSPSPSTVAQAVRSAIGSPAAAASVAR